MNPVLFSEPEGFDSLTLRWIVLEKECPIDLEYTREFLDPLVPVPNLQDRGLFLVEHGPIVQYLQERYPGETLLPGDPKVRAQLRQICSFVRAGVEDLESQMNTILPADGYLTGDQFTLADIYIGARLHERRNRGLTRKVDNYYLRLAGREAFKEAVA